MLRGVKARERLVACRDALLARGGFAAYIPIVVTTILLFYGASWLLFKPISDLGRYQCYALTFWHGGAALKQLPAVQCMFLPPEALTQPRLHMLPLEYPPLTVLLFSLGLFVPPGDYSLLFAIWMALTAVFIYWLLLRYGPRGAALTFALYVLIGGWTTAIARFDLAPAALTLICIIAAERRRWTLAYIALAFGVLLKFYPVLLFPPLLIAEQHDMGRLRLPPSVMTLKTTLVELGASLYEVRKWRWKNSLIFLGLLVAVTGAFALFNFKGAIGNQLGYFAGRPIQIEATGSALLWLGAQFEVFVHTEFSYGSLNLVGALGGVVSLLCTAFFALGYMYTIWLQWRGELDIVQASIAALLVFIATGKVFSPQYLLWIIPLLAYSNALDGFWLLCWGLISLLSTVIYPYLYRGASQITLVPLVPGFIETTVARNALFVLVTLSYLFNWFMARQRTPIILRSETQAAGEERAAASPYDSSRGKAARRSSIQSHNKRIYASKVPIFLKKRLRWASKRELSNPSPQ